MVPTTNLPDLASYPLVMTSCQSAKTAGGEAKLLKMVNDQRARCKLTTLDNVMNHTGFSWVESMIEHARDVYADHSSSALSEADMNVNLLRSPKKDKPKQTKKTAASKKAPPFKKSRMPKESTPPRKSPKKAAPLPRTSSPSPSAPSTSVLQDALPSLNQALGQQTRASRPSSPIEALPSLPIDAGRLQAGSLSLSTAGKAQAASKKGNGREETKVDLVDEAGVTREDRKRKNEEAHESVRQKRKSEEKQVAEKVEMETAEEFRSRSGEGDVDPEKDQAEVISLINETEEVLTAKEGREGIVNAGAEEVVEEDEKEVSRVVVRDDLEQPREEEAASEQKRKEEEEEEQRVQQTTKAEAKVAKAKLDELLKSKAPTSDAAPRNQLSLEDSLSSVESKSLRSDDVFSEGEVEAAPSTGSASSAPKPSLRERIDRFRAIFSPAPRPASSIPRLSPPKALPSPPRPLGFSGAKAAATNLAGRTSPPKSPAKSPPKTLAFAAAPPVKVAAPIPIPTPQVRVAPSVPAPAPAPKPTVSAAVPTPSVKVAEPATVKLTSQIKSTTVKAGLPHQQQKPAPPSAPVINPFQKAHHQQQQQALAAVSEQRAKPQGPPPNTNHIELEEPDSAYSDSDDEETVRRREQHKPWETREGLAKALEEQATVDADMIFGIPYGAVPLDDILPAETENARAKRARPRSSSATWSRDGLKQAEIDRYNERMGIKGPGVLLPITVQDDGSGTPSRTNRLSTIAQSAVAQGQVSRKPSQSGAAAARASVSPVRPTSGAPQRPGMPQTSTGKYAQLVAGTPNRTKASTAQTPAQSTQKTKVSKQTVGSKQTTKASTKNPFQNGAGGGLQTGRMAATTVGGSKVATGAETRKKS